MNYIFGKAVNARGEGERVKGRGICDFENQIGDNNASRQAGMRACVRVRKRE